MRALPINEFERGQEPRESLKIGKGAMEEYLDQFKNLSYVIGSDMRVMLPLYSFERYPELVDSPEYIKYDLDEFLGTNQLNEYPWDFIEKHVNLENLEENQKQNYFYHELFNAIVKEGKSIDSPEVTNIVKDLVEDFGIESLKTQTLSSFFGGHQQELLDIVKFSREEEELESDDLFNFYVFVGRPNFKEVEIEEEFYHKKYLEIENLYQIDRYDKQDLMTIPMMRMRARAQGEKSELFGVYIPKYLHKEKTTYDSQISSKLRKYIDENKFKA